MCLSRISEGGMTTTVRCPLLIRRMRSETSNKTPPPISAVFVAPSQGRTANRTFGGGQKRSLSHSRGWRIAKAPTISAAVATRSAFLRGGAKHDVARLQITMDDAAAMGFRQSRTNLACDFDSSFLRDLSVRR